MDMPQAKQPSVLRVPGKKSVLNSLPCNRSMVHSVANRDAEKIMRELAVLDLPANKIPFWKKASLFTKLIGPSLLLAITHSGNTVVNTIGFFVADKSGSEVTSTAFGLTILINTVTFFSLSVPIIEKVGIACAVSYGAGDLTAVREHFYRGLIIFFLYVAFVFLPIVIFVKQILEAIGISPDVAKEATHYQALLFPIDITRLFGEILVTYMVSQGVEASFGYLTAVSLTIGFGSSYYFGVYKEQYVEGYIIGKAIYEFFNILFICIMFFVKIKGPRFSAKELRSSLRGICSWFRDVLTYTVALYSEFFGYEISTLICTLTDDNVQIAAYTSVVNLAYLVWAVGNGFSNTARTRINYLLGQNKGEAAKVFFYVTTVGMTVFGLFIGGLLFLMNGYVAKIYSNTNVAINGQLVKLIKLYSVLTLGDFFFAYMFTIARSTNQICLNMCLDYLILVFGQFALSYYLVEYKGGNCLTCLGVMEAMLLIIYVILVLRFVMMDWTAIHYEEEVPKLEPAMQGQQVSSGSRIVDGELLAKLVAEEKNGQV